MVEMVSAGLKEQTIKDIGLAVANARAKHPLFATNLHQVVSLATEELGEFAQAINDNNSSKAKAECLDIIAVLIRYLDEYKVKGG